MCGNKTHHSSIGGERGITDVITYANFGDNQQSYLALEGSQILPFP